MPEPEPVRAQEIALAISFATFVLVQFIAIGMQVVMFVLFLNSLPNGMSSLLKAIKEL